MTRFTRRTLLAGAAGSAIGGVAGCTDVLSEDDEAGSGDSDGAASDAASSDGASGQEGSGGLPEYAAYVPSPVDERLNFSYLSLDEFYATESVFELHDPETAPLVTNGDTINTDERDQPVFSFFEAPGLFTLTTVDSLSTAGLDALLPGGTADDSFDEWLRLPVGDDEAPADLLFGAVDTDAAGDLLLSDSSDGSFDPIDAPDRFDGYEQAADSSGGTLRIWVGTDLVVLARNESALEAVAAIDAGDRDTLVEASTVGNRALSYTAPYGSVFCSVSPSVGDSDQFGEGITVYASEIGGVDSEFETAVAASMRDDEDAVDTLEQELFDRGDLVESSVEDGLYTGRGVYSISDVVTDDDDAGSGDDAETTLVTAGQFFDDATPELAPEHGYDDLDFGSVSDDLDRAATALNNGSDGEETEQLQTLVSAYQSFADALRISADAIGDIETAVDHVAENEPSAAADQLSGTADRMQAAVAANDAGRDAVAELDDSTISQTAIDSSAVMDRANTIGATVDGIDSLVEATSAVVDGDQQIGVGFSAANTSDWERAIDAWSTAQDRFSESAAAAESGTEIDGLPESLRTALLERACRSEVFTDGAELLEAAAEDGRDDGFDAYGETAREANQRFEDADRCP